MKNKVVIAVGIMILISIGSIVVILNKTLSDETGKVKKDETSEVAKPVIQEPSPIPKLESWRDEAGFIFQYPSGLKVSQNSSDNNSYANLEISSTKEVGKISIMAVDTRYSDVESWVKHDEAVKGGNIIETTMGGKAAKKLIYFIVNSCLDISHSLSNLIRRHPLGQNSGTSQLSSLFWL